MSDDNDYLVPKAAWKKLKAAMQFSQPIYIYAATGYGKTELIRRFLGKRKYVYHSCADGTRFPEPSSGSGEPVITVIDDMYMINDEAGHARVLALAQNKSVRLVMISRGLIPNWLIPLYVRSGFTMIEEKDLHVPKERALEYLHSQNVELPADEAEEILRKCKGNAYVFIYTVRRLRDGAKNDENLEKAVAEAFSDYLESHVIAQWDSGIAEFMMQLSVVDSFDDSLAEYITGYSHVRELLIKATETGSFLINDGKSYHIIPTMLKALRNRADHVYSKERMREYEYNAGLYYETRENNIKALEMYEKSGYTDRMRELLIRIARSNPGVGFGAELRKYYFAMSEREIDGNPVLMACMSMLYSMLMQSEKSEYWYEKLKKFASDATGGEYREATAGIAYLDISLSHRGSDGLFEAVRRAQNLIDSGLSVPDVSVTSNIPSVINGGKDLCTLIPRAQSIIDNYGSSIEQVLGSDGKGFCDAVMAEIAFETGAEDYNVISLLSRSQMQSEAGGTPAILFVATAIQAKLNLIHGDENSAFQLVESFEQRMTAIGANRLIPNIHALRCRLSLYKNDLAEADSWLAEAPDEDSEFSML